MEKISGKKLNPSAPVDNGAPEGTYTVYVQFVVSKDGNISDVRALTNHGYGMEEEAVRVIKKGPNMDACHSERPPGKCLSQAADHVPGTVRIK